MCAIAGILDLMWDHQILENFSATMARRGPDDTGYYESPACALVHTRLAIIDPEGGRQPMTLHWAGETYTLVYNGELYNAPELKKELLKDGFQYAYIYNLKGGKYYENCPYR